MFVEVPATADPNTYVITTLADYVLLPLPTIMYYRSSSSTKHWPERLYARSPKKLSDIYEWLNVGV
jgi:hypothetical protein